MNHKKNTGHPLAIFVVEDQCFFYAAKLVHVGEPKAEILR